MAYNLSTGIQDKFNCTQFYSSNPHLTTKEMLTLIATEYPKRHLGFAVEEAVIYCIELQYRTKSLDYNSIFNFCSQHNIHSTNRGLMKYLRDLKQRPDFASCTTSSLANGNGNGSGSGNGNRTGTATTTATTSSSNASESAIAIAINDNDPTAAQKEIDQKEKEKKIKEDKEDSQGVLIEKLLKSDSRLKAHMRTPHRDLICIVDMMRDPSMAMSVSREDLGVIHKQLGHNYRYCLNGITQPDIMEAWNHYYQFEFVNDADFLEEMIKFVEGEPLLISIVSPNMLNNMKRKLDMLTIINRTKMDMCSPNNSKTANPNNNTNNNNNNGGGIGNSSGNGNNNGNMIHEKNGSLPRNTCTVDVSFLEKFNRKMDMVENITKIFSFLKNSFIEYEIFIQTVIDPIYQVLTLAKKMFELFYQLPLSSKAIQTLYDSNGENLFEFYNHVNEVLTRVHSVRYHLQIKYVNFERILFEIFPLSTHLDFIAANSSFKGGKIDEENDASSLVNWICPNCSTTNISTQISCGNCQHVHVKRQVNQDSNTHNNLSSNKSASPKSLTSLSADDKSKPKPEPFGKNIDQTLQNLKIFFHSFDDIVVDDQHRIFKKMIEEYLNQFESEVHQNEKLKCLHEIAQTWEKLENQDIAKTEKFRNAIAKDNDVSKMYKIFVSVIAFVDRHNLLDVVKLPIISTSASEFDSKFIPTNSEAKTTNANNNSNNNNDKSNNLDKCDGYDFSKYVSTFPTFGNSQNIIKLLASVLKLREIVETSTSTSTLPSPSTSTLLSSPNASPSASAIANANTSSGAISSDSHSNISNYILTNFEETQDKFVIKTLKLCRRLLSFQQNVNEFDMTKLLEIRYLIILSEFNEKCIDYISRNKTANAKNIYLFAPGQISSLINPIKEFCKTNVSLRGGGPHDHKVFSVAFEFAIQFLLCQSELSFDNAMHPVVSTLISDFEKIGVTAQINNKNISLPLLTKIQK